MKQRPLRSAVAFALIICAAFAAVAQTPPKPKAPASEAASNSADVAQTYRNATFGFRYEIPYGWVDRTKDMRQTQSGTKQDAKGVTEKAAKSDVLLAIFERPPEAAAANVNAAVVIATENAAAYPGLKSAEDYVGPLTELATAKGFKAEGDPAIVEIEGRQLVRADFSKPLNDKVTMRQSTLVMLSKHQIVSFTFIAGTEDDLDQLIERLHFMIGR